MNTAKRQVEEMLTRMPDDCSYEDVQYHLYVIEKIQRGMQRAESEKTYSQEEVEARFAKWDLER
jgi:hypothetical protein